MLWCPTHLWYGCAAGVPTELRGPSCAAGVHRAVLAARLPSGPCRDRFLKSPAAGSDHTVHLDPDLQLGDLDNSLTLVYDASALQDKQVSCARTPAGSSFCC